MKKIFGVALVAMMSLAATPALAADFTGPRVDVHVGSDKVAGGDVSAKGVTAGVEVGYDIAVADNIIAGVEAGLDISGADATLKFNGDEFLKQSARRDLSIGARVGVKASEQTLVYGGLAYTNAAIRTVDSLFGYKATDTLDGYRLSAGVEVGLFKGVNLKGEYRWSDYQYGVTRNDFLVGATYRF